MKATGLIFSNTYDGALGELTEKRATASVPFGGRYRLIDFVLSNMVNSGIISVGVITKYNYRSLLDHIGSGEEWDLNRKNGGLFILPPFITGDFSLPLGKLSTMYNAIPFLKRVNSDYVVLVDAASIYRINFEKVIENHILSNSDVTIVVKNEGYDYVCDDNDVSIKQEDGKISEIYLGYKSPENSLVGIGAYVISRKKLIDTVEEFVSKGRYSFERDFLQSEFIAGRLSINLFEFKGLVLKNRSVNSYFTNNMKLLESEIRNEFFESPVYTKIHNDSPCIYLAECSVNNSLIADGSKIYGTISGSVIFRGVTVMKNSKIKNCIIMQGATISSGCDLENVIVEKNTLIGENVKLRGAEISPVIFR